MEPDDFEPPLVRRPATLPPPPAALEERVVASLQARGLLRDRGAGSQRWLRPLALGLAASLLLAVGFALGRGTDRPAGGDRDRYLLLLYQSPAGQQLGAAARDSVVAEYRVWAGELRDAGRIVMGEELAEGEAVVPAGTGAPSSGSSLLGGFFVIEADDLAQAVAIARTTPHVRRGGTVIVRPITRT